MDLSAFHSSEQIRLAVAIGLGLLVGLERERHGAAKHLATAAGIRTHILISMCGFGCAWLCRSHATLMLPAGALVVGALSVVGYLAKVREGRVGVTSEVAALLTFITGAMALLAPLWTAAAVGIINALVLSEKAMLEQRVELLSNTEFLAVLKFLIVTMVILPALPNRSFTAYALNPRHIWQVVVIVSAVGFFGYFLSLRFGAQVGMWLSAVLGGLVSSTAVTIALGRMAQRAPEQRAMALQSSLLSSAVSYGRVIVLVWLIHPGGMSEVWWKLAVLGLLGGLLALRCGSSAAEPPADAVRTLQNPFELRPALVFAAAFTALSVLTDLVRAAYGAAGMFVMSLLVGVTDITPFVLSLVHRGMALDHVASAAIIVAMMSNTIMKGVYFGVLVKQGRAQTAWRYGAWAALHVPLALLI